MLSDGKSSNESVELKGNLNVSLIELTSLSFRVCRNDEIKLFLSWTDFLLKRPL
jgi:hypothetical protein